MRTDQRRDTWSTIPAARALKDISFGAGHGTKPILTTALNWDRHAPYNDTDDPPLVPYRVGRHCAGLRSIYSNGAESLPVFVDLMQGGSRGPSFFTARQLTPASSHDPWKPGANSRRPPVKIAGFLHHLARSRLSTEPSTG